MEVGGAERCCEKIKDKMQAHLFLRVDHFFYLYLDMRKADSNRERQKRRIIL